MFNIKLELCSKKSGISKKRKSQGSIKVVSTADIQHMYQQLEEVDSTIPPKIGPWKMVDNSIPQSSTSTTGSLSLPTTETETREPEPNQPITKDDNNTPCTTVGVRNSIITLANPRKTTRKMARLPKTSAEQPKQQKQEPKKRGKATLDDPEDLQRRFQEAVERAKKIESDDYLLKRKILILVREARDRSKQKRSVLDEKLLLDEAFSKYKEQNACCNSCGNKFSWAIESPHSLLSYEERRKIGHLLETDTPRHPVIDRIDSSDKQHNPYHGNFQFLCRQCNYGKGPWDAASQMEKIFKEERILRLKAEDALNECLSGNLLAYTEYQSFLLKQEQQEKELAAKVEEGRRILTNQEVQLKAQSDLIKSLPEHLQKQVLDTLEPEMRSVLTNRARLTKPRLKNTVQEILAIEPHALKEYLYADEDEVELPQHIQDRISKLNEVDELMSTNQDQEQEEQDYGDGDDVMED